MTLEENQTGGEQAVDKHLARALQQLTPKQIAEVSPQFHRQTYGPGEIIIHQGAPPDRFYILIRGQAEVCYENLNGEIETVGIRLPGEYFGETGLLQDRPRSATVRAAQGGEVEVLALDRADFREMIDESKATEMHVANEMIRRLITLANAEL